jgi:hypothetical protein
MQDVHHLLIVDLVEWVEKQPRTYAEVMDAWRTSCPRLPVWEDAIDNAFLTRCLADDGSVWISVTPEGRRLLLENGRLRGREAGC